MDYSLGYVSLPKLCAPITDSPSRARTAARQSSSASGTIAPEILILSRLPDVATTSTAERLMQSVQLRDYELPVQPGEAGEAPGTSPTRSTSRRKKGGEGAPP